MAPILPHPTRTVTQVGDDKVMPVWIESFPEGPWQANCYLVGADGRRDAVVIDPGVDAAGPVREMLGERGLTAAGVLLTHGHIDHVASAADVADGYGVPAWIHADDRELLSLAGSFGPGEPDLAVLLGIELREPAQLRLLAGGETVDVAGLSFDVVSAPGHRPGCVLFRLSDDSSGDGNPAPIVFSGDVLFAGSIGRTDLPGGDTDAMLSTLRHVVLALPDEATVLPGHGPSTSVARERATNPYLRPAFWAER